MYRRKTLTDKEAAALFKAGGTDGVIKTKEDEENEMPILRRRNC